MSLGLVPEILNAIDVVFTGGKELGMVDPQMLEVMMKNLQSSAKY